MGQIPCEVSNHSSVIDAKRTTLYRIIEFFKYEEVYFEGNKNVLETMTEDYDSKRVKRNSANEQSFLRISSGLQELGACSETTGTKLSQIEEKIHGMETIIDSTNNSLTYLFLDHAQRVSNLLQEVASKNKQGIELIMDVLKEFAVISES